MGFKNNAYVTLWEIDKTKGKVIEMSEKYATVAVTTSRKKQSGEFETDFTGRVRLVGKAFDKVKGLNLTVGDRLQLTSVDVTNKYDKTKRTTYTNYVCFDFEVAALKDTKPKNVEIVDDPLPIGDLSPDELPF